MSIILRSYVHRCLGLGDWRWRWVICYTRKEFCHRHQSCRDLQVCRFYTSLILYIPAFHHNDITLVLIKIIWLGIPSANYIFEWNNSYSRSLWTRKRTASFKKMLKSTKNYIQKSKTYTSTIQTYTSISLVNSRENT